MLRILHDTKYDFIKYWRHAAISTIVFIVVGLGVLAVRGINYSIEFTSGTLVQLAFATPPGADAVRGAVDDAGFRDAEITQFGDPLNYTVKARAVAGANQAAANADSTAAHIQRSLAARLPNNKVTTVRTESVGPKVGSELRGKAVIAVLISFIVTLIYLAIRFEWRFGVAAIIASAHDILTTLAFMSMMHLEVSLTVVAAILTVIGYSLNDTIIIFDRVRENLKKQRKESLRDVMNRSINETLPRSVLTHVTTLAATLALLIFAGEVIRPFSWIMAFGIFTGTFSSIYVAGAILLWIERKWPRAASTANKGAARAAVEGRRTAAAAANTKAAVR
jgi:preprotein translocase subunit SecF